MGVTASDFAQIPMSADLGSTLARGSELASAAGAGEVMLEHLLAALCEDPDAVAVLDASHINIERLKADVTAQIFHGGYNPAGVHSGLGVSADVRRILEAAAAAARGSRRRDINGAIVLAAIVGDARSIAAEILQAHGLTFDGVIRALQSALAPAPARVPVAEDVLARARQRVQSRAAPSLRDIMKDMPRPAPPPPMPEPPVAEPAAVEPATTAEPPRNAPEAPAQSQAETSPSTPAPETPNKPEAPITTQAHTLPGAGGVAGTLSAPNDGPMPSFGHGGVVDPAKSAGQDVPTPPTGPREPQFSPPGGHVPLDAPAHLRPAAQPPEPAKAPGTESGAPFPGQMPELARPRPGPILPPPIPQPAPVGGAIPGGRRPAPSHANQPMPQPTLRIDHPPMGAPAPPQPQRSGKEKRGKGGKVEVGKLAENIPRAMRVGKTERAEIRIAKASVKALTEGLEGGGPVWQHSVTVTKTMAVRLRAPEGGFFIESASPETQWIENNLGYASDDFASWRFLITPQSRGWARLQIIVSARTIGADGVAAETALPDQVVEVKVRRNVKRAFARLLGWTVAAVIGGALSTFGETGIQLAKMYAQKFIH